MKYNFDQVVDRYHTNSIKYDCKEKRGKAQDILPLWVADMDFKAAKPIIERLHACIEHGIYGYSEAGNEYFRALYQWYKTRFDWEVKEEWLVKTPGIVFALAAAIQAFTKEKDGILIQEPVYYPFRDMIEVNNRTVVNSSLLLKDGHYEMDFDDLEKKIKEQNVKIFFLCSPHNPVGRVWKKEELSKIGEICITNKVILISDEIHSDFTYEGHKHHVFLSLDERFRDWTIVCTAPSKTFNLAGLQVSNIFIPNEELREKFKKAVERTGYCELSYTGLVACQAAYEEGAEWLEEVKAYLKGNLEYVRSFLKEHLPQVELIEPEGTYLIWLDFRKLGLSVEQLEELMEKKAKLWLDGGTMFGEVGAGFQRVNIACPRKILEQALTQLKQVL